MEATILEFVLIISAKSGLSLFCHASFQFSTWPQEMDFVLFLSTYLIISLLQLKMFTEFLLIQNLKLYLLRAS